MNLHRPPTSAGILSVLTALLAAWASLVGLVRPGVYRDPEPFIRAGWMGNDVVALVVMVPTLLVSALAAHRSSPRGILVWLGALDAVLYNYAFYVFGAAPNPLLPLYILIVALSLTALVLGLVSLRPEGAPVLRPIVRRSVQAFMATWALVLGLVWLVPLVAASLRGVPADLNGSVHAFRVTAALDLTLVVPFVLAGAVLLARRHPWSVPVAVVLNVKGVLYPLVLIGSSWTAAMAGVSDAVALVPLWVGFLVASSIALAMMLRPVGVRP